MNTMCPLGLLGPLDAHCVMMSIESNGRPLDVHLTSIVRIRRPLCPLDVMGVYYSSSTVSIVQQMIHLWDPTPPAPSLRYFRFRRRGKYSKGWAKSSKWSIVSIVSIGRPIYDESVYHYHSCSMNTMCPLGLLGPLCPLDAHCVMISIESNGHPLDAHWMSTGCPLDVHWLMGDVHSSHN